MAERLKGKKLRVRVHEYLTDRVHIAYRADYQALAKKDEILVVDDGRDMFHLVEPQGLLHSLRKSCVIVLGPAPATA